MVTSWEQNDPIIKTGAPWEQNDSIVPTGDIGERMGGAFVKGAMRLGEALVDLPKHIVNQVKLIPMATMADEILAARNPQERAAKLKDMASMENFFGKVTHELGRSGELHRAGQQTVLSNHPEWESQPPKSFVDLLTSPDKLAVSLAESVPLLLGAGILTVAGAPQMGVMMMYASEGQEAYDRAIDAGTSEDDAESSYLVYGTVAAALEQMQLQGIIKIGRGVYNKVLNRTAQKVARQGSKSLTMDIIKISAKEALEEASQGEWGDVTAKIIYGEPFGPIGSHIDRRAQEAYVGAVMGLIPAAGGGVAGKVQRTISKPNVVTSITDTHNAEGGSTIDPQTLKPVTTGYTSGTYPERGLVVTGKKISDSVVTQFIADNADILSKDDTMSIGTWFNKETNETHVDLVKNVDSSEEAMSIAQEHDQLYAWDNAGESLIDVEPINPDGSDVTTSSFTYGRAIHRKKSPGTVGKNVWIRESKKKSNQGRTLLVQFSSDLITEKEDPRAKAYYDKLYKVREGYKRFEDFWEIPGWIGGMANTITDSDVYVVRDMEESKRFLSESGYDSVAFSALDVNKGSIKQLGKSFDGDIIIGGEANKSTFKDLPNAKFYGSIEQMAKDRDIPYKPGTDFHHFHDAESIPRLCLSKGCLHKCAFCTVPKGITEITSDIVNKQIDSMSELKAKLVYVDDKTFGQAKNYKTLPRLYKKLKAKNPEFEGFVVQTTASQMLKFDNEFLQDSGIRFIELGIETYNDPLLKELHKPATEKSIDNAVQKIRENGINFIPNIMIGLPGETSDTYQRTLDFLNSNSDIISHLNIYNLAVYEGTELAEVLEAESEADVSENQIQKSFHKNPKVHDNFAEKVYALASSFLDRPVTIKGKPTAPDVVKLPKEPTEQPTTADEAIGKQYGLTSEETNDRLGKAELQYRDLKNKPVAERSKADKEELAFLKRNRKNVEALLNRETQPLEPKRMTKRKALALGHKIPALLGWDDSKRRSFMKDITNVSSMKDMVPAQREQIIAALMREAEKAGIEIDGPDTNPAGELAAKLRERKQKPALTRRDRRNMKKLRKILHTIKSGTSFYFLHSSRLKRLFRSLDNYEDSGPFMRYVYQPVKDADTKANANFTAAMVRTIVTLNDLNIDAPAMMREVKDIGIKDKLSTAERIGTWALAQNSDTRNHLLSEFSEEEIDTVVKSVEASENEMLVAAEIQNYFETGWEEFQAVAEENGIEGVTKVENYMTAFVTDKNDVNQADFLEGLMEQFSTGGVVPGKQHTIERKHGAKRNLELNVFVIHARAARALERFKTMAPAASQVGSILSNKEFKQAINDVTYGHGSRMIDKWLQDSIRGSSAYDSSDLSRSLRWLRMSGIHFVLGFKIITAAKQGISLFPAAAVHPGMLPLMMANLSLGSIPAKYGQMEKEAMSKSDLLRTRDWNRDLRQVYNQKAIQKMYAGKKLSPISMRMASFIDRHTTTVVWTSAYQLSQKHNMSEEESIRFADGVVEDTQPMGKAVDLPSYFRGNELEKNLTVFQNQVNQNGNMFWYDILGETKAKKIGPAMMSYRLLMSQIVPAVLLGMVSRGRPPESVGDIAKDILFYMMSPFVFVGRWAYNVATGDWGPTRMIAEEPFVETGRFASAIKKAVKDGATAEELKGVARYGLRTVGAWSGGKIPLQAISAAEGAWDIATEEDPDFRRLVWSKYALKKNRPSKKLRKKFAR